MRLNIKCKCETDDWIEIRWHIFKNGYKHLRANCSKCNQCQYLPKNLASDLDIKLLSPVYGKKGKGKGKVEEITGTRKELMKRLSDKKLRRYKEYITDKVLRELEE